MAPSASITDFRALLAKSDRILALCGAGLGAGSGLPTFRGAGGLWRNHASTSLATPEAFAADPGLVWLFYAWRRHLCLEANPNDGHRALAALAKSRGMTTPDVDPAAGNVTATKPSPRFLCLTQNVDGLSQRAGHPAESLRTLHGSLLDLRCHKGCGFVDKDNLMDPLCKALAPAAEDYPADKTMPLLDPNVPLAKIEEKDLPKCRSCGGLMRPGVVWFGEALDEQMLDDIDKWINADIIDIVLVIGTAAVVWPAAGYIMKAMRQGAKVVIVNPDENAAEGLPHLSKEDFHFKLGAAEILPLLFEEEIGKDGAKDEAA